MLPAPPLPPPLRHPRANREVRLGEVQIAYEFKRSQRRSIGLSVGPEGLAVRAPRWAALGDVDAALQSKSTWIMRKLLEARQRQAHQVTQAIDWRDGTQLPYLGQTLTVRLEPTFADTLGAAQLISIDPAQVLLRTNLPLSATPQQVQQRVQAWWLQQARQLFQVRLEHFAPLLGVQWQRLSLSNAATRWGSASTAGSIRLNWRLLHLSPALVDYVVVHELSHLRVMNHGPHFWRTLASVLPAYAALRAQLKTERTPNWEHVAAHLA